MKKLFLILIFAPFIVFSQQEDNKVIDWITLENAEKYAAKHNKKILIFFYRSHCEYCEKMQKETLSDKEVINLINKNFLPVMINGYGKDTIIFNNKTYGNQQPASSGRFDWRHDFFHEMAGGKNGQYYTPTTVIIGSNLIKIKSLYGYQVTPLFIRNLKKHIDKKVLKKIQK